MLASQKLISHELCEFHNYVSLHASASKQNIIKIWIKCEMMYQIVVCIEISTCLHFVLISAQWAVSSINGGETWT